MMKKKIHFLKKIKYLFLSMWKLTLGYGNQNQGRWLLPPKVATCPTYKKYICSNLELAQNVKNLEL
jgi:hypothetical protein